MYRLARHQDWATKLHDEVSRNPSRDPVTLQSMTFLNAFINETLRLHPPVPSAGLRNTPAEGIMIGEKFVPGDVTVLVPNYSLGRRLFPVHQSRRQILMRVSSRKLL